MQMLLGDGMMRTVELPLEQTEETLGRVDAIPFRAHVFFGTVTYGAVTALEMLADPAIGPQFIRADVRRRINRLGQFPLECLGCDVRNHLGSHVAWTLDHREYRRLVRAPALFAHALAARFATNPRFIRLDHARKFALLGSGLGWGHRQADAVHEKQGRLVGQIALAGDLQGTHALLGSARSPEREAPRFMRYPAVLHDRTDLDGKLLPAAVTAPEETLASCRSVRVHDLHDFCAIAVRAGGRVTPALFLQKLDCCCLIDARLWDGSQYFGLGFTGMTDFLCHTIILHNAQSVSRKTVRM